MVTVPHSEPNPALESARIAALIERGLEGRRVDVVFVTPETPHQPIHDIARQYGVRL